MTLFRKRYRIESARLADWDYTRPGWYFVTICTKGRRHHFGEVVGRRMCLTDVGYIADRCWLEIPLHSQGVCLDAHVIMPDHVHGLIGLTGETRRSGTASTGPGKKGMQISPAPGSLGAVIRSYKAAVTRWARRNGIKDFVWQPRYYEHIVRSERALCAIRRYIYDNPAHWRAS